MKCSFIFLLTIFFSIHVHSSDRTEEDVSILSVPSAGHLSLDNGNKESIIIDLSSQQEGRGNNTLSSRTSISLKDLKSLQNSVFTEGDAQNTLAIAIYPLSSNREGRNSAYSWDDLDKFGQEVDQRFFKSLSKKVIGGGIFCALFGALVPYPSTGYVIYNIGNFLHIPVGETASDLLITWIVTTTTPAFAQQSFNTGKRIISYIAHEDPFSPTSQNDDSIPHVFQKSRLHYVLKTVLMGSSVINAAIPTILMREAEREFPMFFAVMATPFYLAWMENYYRVGSRNIDHLFEFYSYTTKLNYYKREILNEKILGFKKEIQKDDSLAEKVYNLIQSQMKGKFSNAEGNPFAFSTLFIRNLARMNDDDEEDAGQALLMNFKIDMEGHESSWGDNLANWTSTFLTGAGIYTKYHINQTILYGLMAEFGMSQQDAEIISSTLAGFESCYRIATSSYTQRYYFKSLKNIFSSVNNLTPLRKAAGVTSFINASLFSLPNLVAGLKIFENSSFTSKIAYLAPSFMIDLSYYDAFFNRYTNEVITNVSTIKKSKDMGIIRKRAFIHSYADKALQFINQFDPETIEKLYKILQKGM